jgi:hypothetical protein
MNVAIYGIVDATLYIKHKKTKTMKTKTTYPERARKAKAILIAAVISIQVITIANDTSDVYQENNHANEANVTVTEIPSALNAENAYYYLNDVAVEPEMVIEDWMSNVQYYYLDYCINEEEIELEEWMCNTHHSFWNEIFEAEEPELAIEDWMTKPDEWLETNMEIILSAK